MVNIYRDMEVSVRLFVGNLAWSVDAQCLRKLFQDVGPVVDARVIKERESGRSRGFGFVTFETEDDATRALETFNGSELNGRPLRIDKAIKRDSA